MLAKRIIPCLDIKDGQTVKGTNFVNLRQAGDPVELGRAYSEQGADELVFLDITASHEGRKTFTDLVKRVAANISIPFTVGGGINELSDVDRLLNAGADKVSINSSAIRNPNLIDEIAKHFGSQVCVVAKDICNAALPGLPLNATASTFGKADSNSSLEDVAAGIIHMVLQSIGQSVILAALNSSIKDFVLIGNLAKLPQCKEVFPIMEDMYQCHFLIPEYAQYRTALGAALAYVHQKEKQ